MLWTPAWFTFKGRAGFAVSAAWFSSIRVFEFASHAVCVRMNFSSVWVSVLASTLQWAHKFSGKGWWLARPPSPSPKRCFSGKWGPISQGMTLLRAHLFCCVFFVCLCFVVFLFFVFLFLIFCCFLPQFLANSFKKHPVLEVPNSDRGPSLSAGHLSTWQVWASTLGVLLRLDGFTSDPLFKFNVSFVFCAGFTTLSRLICCFHVRCIWHFPFSLVAFLRSIFSTYDIASFQLALVPSTYSSFVKCAPFQVAFALSMFPPFAIFAFSTCILLTYFFCNSHVCLFQICIFQVHFFCFVSPFFSRCKHPRTSAIRQHNRIHEDGQDTGDDVLRWWTWDSCCDPGCAELLHKGSWYILDSDHLDDSILPFASRC